MALVADRKSKLEEQLKQITDSCMETDDAEAEICRITNLIAMEEEKFTRYHNENARRRHNYMVRIMKNILI